MSQAIEKILVFSFLFFFSLGCTIHTSISDISTNTSVTSEAPSADIISPPVTIVTPNLFNIKGISGVADVTLDNELIWVYNTKN